MDSFEINKIIAAVLLTALIIIGIGKFTDILFHVEKPKESAYKIEGLEVASASGGASAEAAKEVEVVELSALDFTAEQNQEFVEIKSISSEKSGEKHVDEGEGFSLIIEKLKEIKAIWNPY